jgi:tRNA-dihydrouridine synthase 4
MIIAEGFNRSATARDSDFSTAEGDDPLVVQFAACVPEEFAAAAAKAEPYDSVHCHLRTF